MKQAVQVTILGQPYTLRTEASPAEVLKVAAFVNEQVGEIMAAGRTADTLNAVVLALLNMGGAYLRLREGQQEKDQAAVRLQQLLTRLEDALPEIPADPEGNWPGKN